MIRDIQNLKQILKERVGEQKITTLKEIPHPFELYGVKEASEILKNAMQEQKSILVVGDYDADGVMATAVVLEFFRMIDYKNISHIIPDRFKDGYGISTDLIKNTEADIILTVDNGITAVECAQFCAQSGKTLIITDHHTPQDELPQAQIIINPKVSHFVQEDICGALVAWYLCAGLKITLDSKLDLGALLEFVSIAIISDIMPLVEINKTILKKGLKSLNAPIYPATKILKQKHKKIDSQAIGFYIAPLINCAGRIAHANIALDFMLSKTIEEAKDGYKKLQELNSMRKALQDDVLQEALACAIESKECVVAYSEGWNEGVLGIVCAKLAEHYKKSAFTFKKADGVLGGSGRAYGNVDLFCSTKKLEHILQKFGGHSGAIGLSLQEEHIQTLLDEFREISIEVDSIEESAIDIDSVFLANQHREILQALDEFAPYGEGNEEPLFRLKDVSVGATTIIGSNKNHSRLDLLLGGGVFKMMAFFQDIQAQKLQWVTFNIKNDDFSKSAMGIIREHSCHL